MLVFTRKSRESVVVGGSNPLEQMLRVTVLEICRGKVRLGFEADATVPVHRSEVWERIRADNVRPGLAPGMLAAPASG
ncbi:MAG: carbon storage regulator [Planctomycetes bacterium]|nr:carbon storage regulator [Planctomycetota bacterium]